MLRWLSGDSRQSRIGHAFITSCQESILLRHKMLQGPRAQIITIGAKFQPSPANFHFRYSVRYGSNDRRRKLGNLSNSCFFYVGTSYSIYRFEYPSWLYIIDHRRLFFRQKFKEVIKTHSLNSAKMYTTSLSFASMAILVSNVVLSSASSFSFNSCQPASAFTTLEFVSTPNSTYNSIGQCSSSCPGATYIALYNTYVQPLSKNIPTSY